MDERRKHLRVRTLKAAKIIVKLHSSVVDCVVRNKSDHGALILVPSLVGIPASFELVMDSDHIRHDCRVAWRGNDRLGVEFA